MSSSDWFDWKLKDTYGMGVFIYFVKTLILYGLLFTILLLVYMAAIDAGMYVLLWLAFLNFIHFFGQFTYGLPVYYLLKDTGNPKVAKGFIWSSVVPLIMLAIVIIYLIINYDWSKLSLPEKWT